MIQTIQLLPGITLRCFRDDRFKQSCLSVQFLRSMCAEEASLNALLPAILLRGTKSAPDLRAITQRLDDLYGASVGALVRRVGDYQTTGLYCSFVDPRYVLQGDQIFAPMLEFLGDLLLDPVTENGVFSTDYVESEKRNLISAIETQRNDKRAYANSQLIGKMCKGDSFGIPRLGTAEQVRAITAESAFAHYRKVLRESPVHLFYVGAADAQEVARQLTPLFAGLERQPVSLPAQTGFTGGTPAEHTQHMDVTQGKLCMGFTTPITLRQPEFAAMQVLNMLFGGSMTNKLFMIIREKLSLCYDIGSGYHGSKGIVTVSAGIDFDQEEAVRKLVLQQLDACRQGDFTAQELESAKQALLSQLRATHDSPGAIEGYYASGVLSGLDKTPEQYMAAVEAVTRQQVQQAADSLKLHTVYFLRGQR